MASSNFTLNHVSVRGATSALRQCWLALVDLHLALEFRDTVTQDRNPTMTNALALVNDNMQSALDELEFLVEGASHE